MTISQEEISEIIRYRIYKKALLNHVIFIKIGTRLKGGV